MRGGSETRRGEHAARQGRSSLWAPPELHARRRASSPATPGGNPPSAAGSTPFVSLSSGRSTPNACALSSTSEPVHNENSSRTPRSVNTWNAGPTRSAASSTSMCTGIESHSTRRRCADAKKSHGAHAEALPPRSLSAGLRASRHLVGRDVLDVRRDPPLIALGVEDSGHAVAIELIRRRT